MLETKVVFESQNQITRHLGKSGSDYLQKVLALIQQEASEKSWPLREVIVRYERDPENKKWEYIVVELIFDALEEEAAAYLKSIFPLIDSLEKPGDTGRENTYLENIFYDFATI
jgi:hypothetical protein